MKKDKERPEGTESWKVCGSLPVTAFIFALASMVFDSEFARMLAERQWGHLIVWVLVTCIGFAAFWAAVYAVFDQLEKKIPQKLKRFSKWFAAATAVLVFAIVYFMIHYVI